MRTCSPISPPAHDPVPGSVVECRLQQGTSPSSPVRISRTARANATIYATLTLKTSPACRLSVTITRVCSLNTPSTPARSPAACTAAAPERRPTGRFRGLWSRPLLIPSLAIPPPLVPAGTPRQGLPAVDQTNPVLSGPYSSANRQLQLRRFELPAARRRKRYTAGSFLNYDNQRQHQRVFSAFMYARANSF